MDVPFSRQFSFHDFIVRIFHKPSPGNALMVGRQLDRCHGLQDPKLLAVSGSSSISMGFSMGFSIMNHPFWGTPMESPNSSAFDPSAAFSKCATLGSSGAKRRRHEKAPKRSINCGGFTGEMWGSLAQKIEGFRDDQ